MKLTEILTESEQQQLDELDIGKAATAVGKGIGAVGKGIGAVAGAPQGIGRAIKKGYKSAVSTIGGDDEPKKTEPAAASPAPSGGVSGFLSAVRGSDQAGAPASSAATQNAGQDVFAQIKANIDKLDTKGKQKILALLQKSLPQTPAKPAEEPKAATAEPAAPAQEPKASAPATTANPDTTVQDISARRQARQAAATTAARASMKQSPAPAKQEPVDYDVPTYQRKGAAAPVTTPVQTPKAAASYGKGVAMPTKPMQIPGAGTKPVANPKPVTAPSSATGAGVKQLATPARKRDPKKAALLQPQTASVHRTEPALSESYRSIFVKK